MRLVGFLVAWTLFGVTLTRASEKKSENTKYAYEIACRTEGTAIAELHPRVSAIFNSRLDGFSLLPKSDEKESDIDCGDMKSIFRFLENNSKAFEESHLSKKQIENAKKIINNLMLSLKKCKYEICLNSEFYNIHKYPKLGILFKGGKIGAVFTVCKLKLSRFDVNCKGPIYIEIMHLISFLKGGGKAAMDEVVKLSLLDKRCMYIEVISYPSSLSFYQDFGFGYATETTSGYYVTKLQISPLRSILLGEHKPRISTKALRRLTRIIKISKLLPTQEKREKTTKKRNNPSIVVKKSFKKFCNHSALL